MSYKEPYTEKLRVKFLKYIRNAFKALPKLETPKILELGCGSGQITLELAQITEGQIIAIDIDPIQLTELEKKVKGRNLDDRIQIKRMDFLKNSFSQDLFDLIWEEGVVHIIGLEKSLKECQRILKPGGYIVLGQAIKAVEPKQDLINRCGFELINQLNWKENCWWTDFYAPLEQKVKQIQEGKENNIFKNISAIKHEIRMVKANPKEFDCAHFILKKIDENHT